ncbi:membrane-bound ClpP family serine protease [Staphylococcus auricularis]
MNLLSGIQNILLLNFADGIEWYQRIADFIVNPIVSLVFTIIIFLGFLYQLYSRRINMAGIVAALLLLIFFLGFLIKGEVNLVSVILFVIGVIFISIELFVVGAVMGIIGMGLVVLSIMMLGDSLLVMIVNVVIALILAIIEWVILVKIFNRSIPFLDKVILKDSTNAEAGYTSHDNRSDLVNKTAKTLTDLRPAGIISIDGERIDAVSDGEFILRNKTVTVLQVEGTRVVVREKE